MKLRTIEKINKKKNKATEQQETNECKKKKSNEQLRRNGKQRNKQYLKSLPSSETVFDVTGTRRGFLTYRR